MKLFLENGQKFIDIHAGIDISISFGGENNVNAWYLEDPVLQPVQMDDFIGSVDRGAPVNFNNIFFNPHAHVTHTECLGHITREVFSVNKITHPLFYKARVISIHPEKKDTGDEVISVDQLRLFDMKQNKVEALIIRTLPNNPNKKRKRYSHTNPPYLDVACADFLIEMGVQHLLIDLPSVDKEEDGGELAFHHAFWQVPLQPNHSRTITEFIFVPETCEDGEYVLNLQVAPIENDASPSRPVLYKIFEL